MSDPAPKRRLPFKPTALRKAKSDTPQIPKPSSDGDGDDLALFRRSRHMMPLMTADAERRLKREKEKEEARKRRSETAEQEQGSEEPSSAQKRRASECEVGEGGRCYSTPSRQIRSPGSSSKRHHADFASPTKLGTPTRVEESSTPVPSPSLGDDNTIAILDDDDVFTTTPQTDSPVKSAGVRRAADSFQSGATDSSTPAPGSAPVEIIDAEDEDDVEEVPVPSEEETDPDLQVFINAARERQRLADSQKSHPSTENLKVQVESTIPRTLVNDKPVAFKLNSADPLKGLKTTWCSVMQMNHVDVTADDIFFTWRGRRLYNTTTLCGLGIATMGNELLYAGDVGDRRGFSADRKRVVLQAWTEELFEAHLAEEEKEERRRRGELDEEEELSAPAEEKIRVTMRSKQGELVRVTTTASSTIGDLVEKFRVKRHLPVEVKVSIYWDGEGLEEGVSLRDADIGDDDQVEVHLN